MDIFKSFSTDKTLEQEGVWHEVGPETAVLVARANNPAFVKMLVQEHKKYKHALDSGTPEAEKLSEDLMIRVLATTVLKGWRGVTKDGKEFPYSQANAEEALRVQDFRIFVVELANEVDHYRRRSEEAIAKN